MRSKNVILLCILSFLVGVSAWYWRLPVPGKAQMPSTLQPVTSGAMSGACNGGQGMVLSTSGIIYVCYNGQWAAIAPMSGTTGNIGGSLLASVGAAATGTATVQGATTGQPCEAAATDGTNMLSLGFNVHCDITAANTATVTVSAIIIGTPAAKAYNVRIP